MTPAPPTSAMSNVFDRLLDRRVLVLGDAVEDESANRLVAQLLVLSTDDPHSDICLHINSPGGSVAAGLAIYDAMQLIPNDVATVAVGFAASMGQILLCAGAPGKRYALPHAQVVMHEGSAGLGGAAADVAIQAENLQATLHRLRAVIAHHTGRTIEEVERRRRSRSVVRCRASQGVRVHRPGRDLAGPDRPGPGEPASASRARREQLHDPQRHRVDAPR